MDKPLFCVEVYKGILRTEGYSYFMSVCPTCKEIIKKKYNIYFKYYDKEGCRVLSYCMGMYISCFITKIQDKPLKDIAQFVPLEIMKSSVKIKPNIVDINPHAVTPVFSEEYARDFIRETKRTDMYAEDDFVYERYADRPKEYYHE